MRCSATKLLNTAVCNMHHTLLLAGIMLQRVKASYPLFPALYAPHTHMYAPWLIAVQMI
jgi:hypothetical protein